jgi:hypothetical protein
MTLLRQPSGDGAIISPDVTEWSEQPEHAACGGEEDLDPFRGIGFDVDAPGEEGLVN